MADISINTKTMYTKFSTWTYDGNAWKGLCRECKGEKAKYTPSILKREGVKPCTLCTNIDEYDKASTHVEREN